MDESLSLSALMAHISEAVASAMPDAVWLRAEVSEMRVNANGHCYLTFVEKDVATGQLLAQCRGIVWSRNWWLVRDTFERATGQPLRAGLKVLVRVEANFSPAYGLSLIVWDIDPAYTLGEMARRRQEIISRLTEEGMIDMNGRLPFPTLPRRVAVISAEGAAGYGDFRNQLIHNPWGVQFYVHLFPAVMQGALTESSVIAALDRIYSHQDLFDVVVIIRGGGATADLASFDSYDIAVNIANFPLPVITGIGHDRDTTVLDAVAHTSVKTPTAAAALLIDAMSEQLSLTDSLQEAVTESVRSLIREQRLRLTQATLTLSSLQTAKVIPLRQQLTVLQERLRLLPAQRLERTRRELTHLEDLIALVQPEHILHRGFSITRAGGRVVTSADAVAPGSVIETQLASGTITSTVTQ